MHPLLGSFGVLSNPQALAVDQASGDVYVLDVGTESVVKFDASGAPSNFSALATNVLDGSTTPEGSFSFDSNSAAQIAVDNSGGATEGDIYITNSFAGVIDVFDATGSFVGEITDAGATPLTGGEACGVATDPAGHLYISFFGSHVDVYTPTDSNPAHDTFDAQLENTPENCNVAADSTGRMYVSAWALGPLRAYEPSQLGVESPFGGQVDAKSQALTVDPSSNDVFVDEGDRVVQFDPAGTRTGQSGLGTLSGSSYGVAIRAATGDLYASDAATGVIDHFGPAIQLEAPTVTIAPPTGVSESEATFSGTVNPQGTEPLSDTHWHFEYSIDAGATWTSTTGGDAGTGTSDVPVTDQVSGLLPDQTVQVRLIAANSAGTTTSTVETFTTTAVAPDATTAPAQDLAPAHATLEGVVNPHDAPTTYFFEYGPTTSYGSSVPATEDADAGAGTLGVPAIQRIDGLTPGTTYHYRLLAHSVGGTATGQDQTFATTLAPPPSVARAEVPGTGFLPDNRGWEQVSPVDKNGGDIGTVSVRTRAAAGGGAAMFTSLSGFADALGTGVATDYMSVRDGTPGTTGWATHAITPKQDPLTFIAGLQNFDPLWEGEFSDDFTHGVFRAWSPLTSAPSVADVENLYVRNDLRTPGSGSYQLLTPCPGCVSPLPPITSTVQRPHLAGASRDYGHVIFESIYPLVPDATADPATRTPNLYEWVNGTLRLAGVLPDSACGSPPCLPARSIAGQGALNGNYTAHTISADGSRIFFTDSSATESNDGALYVRVDGTTTVQINASEKTTPAAPQPARFWTASDDGTRVFFTTGEQLTDDDTDGAVDLYMYDSAAPSGHHLTRLSVDHEPADQANGVVGVIGASADGSTVYFVAAGQLVAGEPALPSDFGIYEWHDGALSYVGQMASPGSDTNLDLPGTSGATPFAARVTQDGRHMLFISHSGIGLTGYQQQGCEGLGCAEVYVYSADTHRLACASCNPSGTPATVNATTNTIQGTGAAEIAGHLNHPLSEDGAYAFFSTAEALVPQDTNARSDAYEYDVASGTVHLLSSGTSASGSYFMDASGDGRDAFFVTRQGLAGRDLDQSVDLYDARVDGGLLDPPVTPPDCVGDACRASSPPPAGISQSGSAALNGPGNAHSLPKPKPKPRSHRRAPRCRHGLVHRRVHGRLRCARPLRRHAATRATHPTRTAGRAK